MIFKSVCLATVLTLGAAGVAQAGPFGPAKASIGSNDVPTVTINNGNGNDSIMLNGNVAGQTSQLNAGSGSLSGTPFVGKGVGTLFFMETPNTITSDAITALYTFNDNKGGVYQFDLTSIDTITFSNAPGVSSSIGLYLLGNMFDTNLGLSATPTSITLTFNSTGGSPYSESGSLANPPTPTPPPSVPEPASLALLGAGLASVGFFRRRK